MTKYILDEYFVVIKISLIVLLLPCLTKMLGTIGYHPRHKNNTHKHLYHVFLINLTPLTSCSYILQLQPTNFKLQHVTQCTFVVVISQSNLDKVS
jgi:hypothetical protein